MPSPQPDILSWITNQGFAVAVAAFLLVRLEHRLGRLETALRDLVEQIRIERVEAHHPPVAPAPPAPR